jgi:hypothetical protein
MFSPKFAEEGVGFTPAPNVVPFSVDTVVVVVLPISRLVICVSFNTKQTVKACLIGRREATIWFMSGAL